MPTLMRARPRVILRETKISPRTGRLVVEQECRYKGEQTVGLTIVDGDPIGVQLRDAVG